MNFSQLEALVAVADAGSFAAAADRLDVTPSGVSHAIAALEAEVGVPLLARGRGGASPTDVGERVLAHAREVVARRDLIRREASAARGLEVGALRVGGFPSACARLVPGIVSAFTRLHPGIEISLTQALDEQVQTWLRSNVIDVGFVMLPVDGLRTQVLVHDPMVALLPPGHPLAGRGALHVRDLARGPFILAEGRTAPIVRAQFHDLGLELEPSFAVRDLSVLFAMVQEGLGVSVLPAMAVPADLPRVAVRMLRPSGERSVGLAVRDDGTPLPAASAFVGCAVDWARETGYLA
jgi:DNA-binding transcriptional LysR family regulator